MQYAFVNGKRQRAFKDGRGICPQCQKTVIASCGEIYIWHWKHQTSCDSWFEPETEWHLDWKEQFPEDWQEVIIEDDTTGIKHIADIKTAEGIVIEFQNSSISSAEIQAREAFYKNMIWVVNAKDFKANFSLGSVVNNKLRVLERNIDSQKKEITTQTEKELNKAKSDLESFERDYVSIKNSKTRLEDNIFEYVEYLSQSECFSKIIIVQLRQANSITEMESLTQAYTIARMIVTELESHSKTNQEAKINYLTFRRSIHDISYKIGDLLKEIKNDVGEKIVILNQKIQSLWMNFYQLEQRKKYLTDLPDSDFLQGYKVINFNQIEKDQIENIKILETETKYTLFPACHNMTEEILSDLLVYHYGYKDHEILFDIQPELEYINQILKAIEDEIRKESWQYIVLSNKVRDLVEAWITNKIYDIENQYNELNLKLNEQEKVIKHEKYKLKKQEIEIQEKLKKTLADLERDSKSTSIFIKQKYKKLYFYNWKHERKTWKYAKKAVYFDFGDGVLFERRSDNLFRKILKQDFIDKYRN